VLAYYRDRPVVVTGCASGIGAAVGRMLVEAGSWVIGIDRSRPDYALQQFVPTDLGDLGSVQTAITSLPTEVWSLFSCAGLSSGAADPLTVLRVNFLGLREFLEGVEARVPSGGAMVSIGSAAGRDYRENSREVFGLVHTASFNDGEKWMQEHASYIQDRGGYRVSKEAIVLYTMLKCWSLGQRGVRINALAPGVTDTPMLRDSARVHGWGRLDAALGPLGRKATADEQARTLMFLNSGWASYVNGQTIWSDGGAIATAELQRLAVVDVG
jgi:NAD(P)-dependent dehydrogenase (short-subunit alcohol dehydrogenase family)